MAEKDQQKGGTPLITQADIAQAIASAQTGGIEQYSPEQIISGLLSETAKEVLPNSGFKYGQDQLPDWFPDILKPVVENQMPGVTRQDLQGVYDPYMGVVAQQGDERTYLGQTKPKPVWVEDMKHWTTFEDQAHDIQHNASAKDKAQGDVTRANAANKVEHQLGNDPGQQATDETMKKRRGDKTMTAEQVKNLPYLWSTDKVHDAMKRFRSAGWNVQSFDDLTGAWSSLVDRASMTYSLSAGKRKVTPWDVLELSKREAQAAGSFVNYQNGSETRTSKSVSDISEGASWQVLRQTLSSLLGRDPSDQELRDYTYRMNTLAAQNPSITETTTRYQAGKAVSSKSHTTPGFDAGDMAKEAYDQAQEDPDYGAYQAGSTIFNWAVDALGAIGDT